MGYYLVYTTYPNKTIGSEVAKEVVQKKYAACANLLENTTSFYRWQGNVETEKEVIIIFKTTKDKYSLLETNLKSSHPYECPCILVVEIKNGNQDFLNWISENTA